LSLRAEREIPETLRKLIPAQDMIHCSHQGFLSSLGMTAVGALEKCTFLNHSSKKGGST